MFHPRKVSKIVSEIWYLGPTLEVMGPVTYLCSVSRTLYEAQIQLNQFKNVPLRKDKWLTTWNQVYIPWRFTTFILNIFYQILLNISKLFIFTGWCKSQYTLEIKTYEYIFSLQFLLNLINCHFSIYNYLYKHIHKYSFTLSTQNGYRPYS